MEAPSPTGIQLGDFNAEVIWDCGLEHYMWLLNMTGLSHSVAASDLPWWVRALTGIPAKAEAALPLRT